MSPGTRIGVYEVVSPIGAGGMGQVWLASDTTLGRQVAIKILPDAFAADPARLARFDREAKTLASLNHPHIAAIYGFETFRVGGPSDPPMRALIMELVDGDDLAERIRLGPVPLEEALPIARQIAAALEAAHEQGIVHRDLKPANIKVRIDGTVKVLDFGLAKATDNSSGLSSQGSGVGPSSATVTSPAMTMQGMILGTAAYMSPEQASGRPVDKRSDLWSFGVVLTEMLTGQPVFTGETISHVIAAVLKSEPDFSPLPAHTPSSIRRLLRRCLEKDRQRRLDSAGSVRLDLDEILARPTTGEFVAPVAESRPRSRVAAVLPWLLLVATLVGGAAWWQSQPSTPTPLVSRSLIAFPQFAMAGARLGNFIAISTDGARVVYVGNPDGRNRLYVRSLDHFEAVVVNGTEDASQPFFSPDGGSLGFFSAGKLKTVSLSGGAPVALADAPSPLGGAWGPGGTIVFAPDRTGLQRVAAGGGPVTPVTKVGDVTSHSWPTFLPGGDRIMFTVVLSASSARIDVVTLQTGTTQTIVAEGAGAAFAESGHLVYGHPLNGTLLAAPFNPETLAPVTSSVMVVDGVLSSLYAPQFSLSSTGTLVYVPNSAISDRTVLWVDRAGRTTQALEQRGGLALPRLSPDGGRVSLTLYEGMSPRHILVYELLRGTSRRVTANAEGLVNAVAAWSPDGRQMLVHSNRTGTNKLFLVSSDGTGATVPLIPNEGPFTSNDWSPDGRHVVFTLTRPETGYDLWTLALGESQGKSFLTTPFNELAADFSPDSRYLAYISDRSGRNEIYVQPFPGPGDMVQVSTDGGTEPAWAPRGQELFYRQGDKMMVVKVTTSPELVLSKPQVLFEGRFEVSPSVPGYKYYDVAPDGQRFMMLQSDAPAASRQLYLVTNWFEELRAKVPGGRP